jgi:hypothetical protein
MENLRMLLAAIVALTLVFSVVSSINPVYFAGLNAYADNSERDEEDDDNTTDENQSDEEEQDNAELVQPLGAHGHATLDSGDDELDVEVHEGDLADGTYHVMFNCTTPDINQKFTDGLVVEDGQGEFEEHFAFVNATYTGCEISVGTLSAIFPTFTVQAHVEDDEEDDDEKNGRDNEEDDEQNDDKVDHEQNNKENGRHNDDDEQNDSDDQNNTVNDEDDDVKEKRKEKSERIASTVTGSEIHERHSKANAESPGEYVPNSNYTLSANGTAMNNSTQADSDVNLDLAVWKSNGAIVLLDVLGGTVDVGNQTYTVVIGYALYSVNHDAMKIATLAVDEDGNIIKLKLRGSAIDEESKLPTDSGSVDLTFEGSSDAWNSRLGDWKLELEGTLTA